MCSSVWRVALWTPAGRHGISSLTVVYGCSSAVSTGHVTSQPRDCQRLESLAPRGMHTGALIAGATLDAGGHTSFRTLTAAGKSDAWGKL